MSASEDLEKQLPQDGAVPPAEPVPLVEAPQAEPAPAPDVPDGPPQAALLVVNLEECHLIRYFLENVNVKPLHADAMAIVVHGQSLMRKVIAAVSRMQPKTSPD